MNFHYEKDRLHWQSLDLTKFCTDIEKKLESDFDYTGPYFLYNKNVLQERIQALLDTFPLSRFYYSVKSLSNIHILKIIRQHERMGLDVVSGGEILRALSANFSGKDLVFAGVGKTRKEIILGLQKEIKSFHVESIAEIKAIAAIAASLNKTANIALRLNPNINVDTHEYITTAKEENKFGISQTEIKDALQCISESASLKLNGLQIHLGSQLTDTKPYLLSLDYLLKIKKEIGDINNVNIEYFSLGGGFGIDYVHHQDDSQVNEFPIENFSKQLANYQNENIRIDFEPGRYISAPSGILISEVTYLKQKKDFTIAICNSGMSEFIRPALYKAKHPVLSLQNNNDISEYDIVGPICESADFFALKNSMPELTIGSRLAVLNAGAYGSVMSSNYNTRPLVPEILIQENGQWLVIRKPQTVQQILELEEID